MTFLSCISDFLENYDKGMHFSVFRKHVTSVGVGVGV